MSQEKKQLNMSIDNGADFFAHETSINFSPTQFILDFKCVTPRVDPRSKDTPVISLKHNIVMIEPFHAKRMLSVLSKSLEEYEKQFGKIEKSSAMKKHEKNIEKQDKDTKEKMPDYFG